MKTSRTLVAILVTGTACLASTGCSELDDYFSTVASESLFLGVDEPDVASAAGLSSELAAGATATAFLAKARSLGNVAANMFSDADSVAIDDGITSVELLPRGNGLYSANSIEDPMLAYVIGRTYTLEVYENGRLYNAEMMAPPPPNLSGLPDAEAGQYHPAGIGLNVLLGQQFDNYLAVVADESGDITYSNQPETASEYLDWIGGSSVFTSFTIPGSAFPSSGTAYLIGVAGIRSASNSAFDNFNPLVSNLAMGSMTLTPLVTAP